MARHASSISLRAVLLAHKWAIDREVKRATVNPLLLQAESVHPDEALLATQFEAGTKWPHYKTPTGATIQMNDAAAQDSVVSGSIGVVPINGVMVMACPTYMEAYYGLCSMERVAADILRMGADPRVKSVLICATSPGGQIIGIEKIHNAILTVRATKPVEASVDGYACSACLFAISACGAIHLEGKTTQVGSLGVMACVWDDSKMMADFGIEEITKYAQQSTRKNEADRALLNEKDATKLVAELTAECALFLDMAKAGRPSMSAEAATGAMFLGEAAIANGLADDILPLDAVIQQALAAETTPTDVVLQVEVESPSASAMRASASSAPSAENPSAAPSAIPTATPAAQSATPMKEKFQMAFAAIAAMASNLFATNNKLSEQDINAINAEFVKAGVKDAGEFLGAEQLATLRQAQASLDQLKTSAEADATTRSTAAAKRVAEVSALLKDHGKEALKAEATEEDAISALVAHAKTLGSTTPAVPHTGAAAPASSNEQVKYPGHDEALAALRGEGAHSVATTH